MKKQLAILSASLGLAVSASAFQVTTTNVTDLASTISSTAVVTTAGVAASFTTGSAATTLYAASLLLDPASAPTGVFGFSGGGSVGFTPDGTLGYTAYVYGNNSGVPGTELYSLGSGAAGANNTLVAFSAPANSSLAAETTYWLVLKTAAGDQGDWIDTTSASVVSPDGWTIGADGYNIYTSSSFAATPLFAITTTPEPGTMALAGIGALGMILFRRRNAL